MTAWRLIHRGHPVGAAIADRHYSRKSPGAAQFVPPGRCVVLLAEGSTRRGGALWVTSWPLPQYVQHAWPGAWVCSLFRNELPDRYLSSDLIGQAVAITGHLWPVPPLGIVTFVNSARVRRKRDPGRCFRRAGWQPIGHTRSGLLALRQLPADMPPPAAPSHEQTDLFRSAA